MQSSDDLSTHTRGDAMRRSVAGRRLARSMKMMAAALPVLFLFVGDAVGQGRIPAGGRGPIKVLLITKGHAFDRAPFFAMFDSLGNDITWTHVEHPAARAFWDPELAEPYDVLVYYDMAGRSTGTAGNRNYEGGTPGVPGSNTTASVEDIVPSEEEQENFEDLLESGKPMLFFHHSLASWVHTWPEYIEVMGGACDWGREIITRGVRHPRSGYHQNTVQQITVVADHPITQGLGNFEITDESYTCPMFEDSVTPLLRTSWKPASAEAQAANMNPEWTFSNLFAWVKTAENSPIVYIQGGHNAVAWENPKFVQLMGNAIKWLSSDEAKSWARANPTDIF